MFHLKISKYITFKKRNTRSWKLELFHAFLKDCFSAYISKNLEYLRSILNMFCALIVGTVYFENKSLGMGSSWNRKWWPNQDKQLPHALQSSEDNDLGSVRVREEGSLQFWKVGRYTEYRQNLFLSIRIYWFVCVKLKNKAAIRLMWL